jgi:hypothetical protein
MIWGVLTVVIVVVLLAYMLVQPGGDSDSEQEVVEQVVEPKPEPPVVEEPKVEPKVEKEEPKLTTVEVRTKPEGAKILVNGKESSGATPTTIENLPIGEEVEIQARLFGYSSESKKVMTSDQPTALDFELKPAKLNVKFESDPKGAMVYVEGDRFVRTTLNAKKKELAPNFSYELKRAKYDTLTGSVSEKDWVENDDGYSLEVTVTLQKTVVEAKKPATKAPPKPKPKPAGAKPDKPKPKPAEAKPEEPKPKPAEEKPSPDIEENPF